jgi:hypothetical protein
MRKTRIGAAAAVVLGAMAAGCTPRPATEHIVIDSPPVPIGVRLIEGGIACRHASLRLEGEYRLEGESTSDVIATLAEECVAEIADRSLFLLALVKPAVAAAGGAAKFTACVAGRAPGKVEIVSAEVGVTIGEWGGC